MKGLSHIIRDPVEAIPLVENKVMLKCVLITHFLLIGQTKDSSVCKPI